MYLDQGFLAPPVDMLIITYSNIKYLRLFCRIAAYNKLSLLEYSFTNNVFGCLRMPLRFWLTAVQLLYPLDVTKFLWQCLSLLRNIICLVLEILVKKSVRFLLFSSFFKCYIAYGQFEHYNK